MLEIKTPTSAVLLTTLHACLKNGDRLLEESYSLEFEEPPSTRYFIVMIAQEELAKAFIFYLVRESAIPFSEGVLRAINDHSCKQLVGVIMDYMIMHWDEIDELREALKIDYALGHDQLPAPVGSAMALLRYEKIGKWEGSRNGLAHGSDYEPSARRIAEGKKDSHKQDALYVRVGRDGRVSSTPEKISAEETQTEFERAKRYKRFVDSLLAADRKSDHRYEKAMAALRLLFGTR
jgi:hypothetical protein